MLILIIGDIHFPFRSPSIPIQFKKFLHSGRIQHILCTGNLCTRGMADYLRSICPDLHIVRGDFDNTTSVAMNQTNSSGSLWNSSEQKVVTIGGIRIGLCHGHQLIPISKKGILLMLGQQLDVNILVTGHLNRYHILEADKKIFLNPGSASGAFSPSFDDDYDGGLLHENGGDYNHDELKLVALGQVGVPSFMLLDADTNDINIYVYNLINGEVDIHKYVLARSPN
ncbi:hypothetical protein ACOME3_009616 [Neoechinorhynchus agilis]